ncbi:conserved exported protein of unknown function [Candidatus Filomicrobium marinum]|uniref:Uncharacterized protein n=1 Tax=Candidatus Filomicrobium marinum TaxID=1608628 RepID=A0A0D6JJH5_9HYPH|nr:conserved exported protein of unknown function [Candidatus Filomicrobium marinum]CPR22113.1 conserved exported protein of unknown function [Candidatus Filomicrobium marinum]
MAAGRSPRGRRSPCWVVAIITSIGSISAWAEEPVEREKLPVDRGVDLRVGGGAPCHSIPGLPFPGRSPRGRRSH